MNESDKHSSEGNPNRRQEEEKKEQRQEDASDGQDDLFSQPQ